nr:serine hydrolase [uncultured Cetobacterium sp.]
MKILMIFFMVVFTNLSFAEKILPDYRSFLVGDTTGKIFFEENSEIKYPLASVTKVMTIMVTLDEVRKGNVGLYDEVPIDWEAVSVGGSLIPVKSGEKMLLIDLLKSTAIKSANNAAYAMAKYVGKGSISHFVDMMNEKTKKLGLDEELDFYTPAGLPDYMTKKKMDMGTAKGIYGMTLEALKYPEYLEIAKQKRATIKNGEYTLKSTILLLGKEGIYGLKTGYHRKARFNITILSNKDGANIVTVVMGGKTQDIRDEKVLSLNEKFHSIYRNKDIIKKDIPLLSIPVEDGYNSFVKVYPTKNFSMILKRDSDVKISLERLKKIKAPMLKGTRVGKFNVLVNGEKVFTGDLTIKKDITEKSTLDKIIDFF